MSIAGHNLRLNAATEILGASLVMDGAGTEEQRQGREIKRAQKWDRRTKRLRSVPGTPVFRSAVGAACVEGLAYLPLSDRSLVVHDKALRRFSVEALRGLAVRAPEEAQELELAALCRGQALDPLWCKVAALMRFWRTDDQFMKQIGEMDVGVDFLWTWRALSTRTFAISDSLAKV